MSSAASSPEKWNWVKVPQAGKEIHTKCLNTVLLISKIRKGSKIPCSVEQRNIHSLNLYQKPMQTTWEICSNHPIKCKVVFSFICFFFTYSTICLCHRVGNYHIHQAIQSQYHYNSSNDWSHSHEIWNAISQSTHWFAAVIKNNNNRLI